MTGKALMVDITDKPISYREARASGFIRLKPETVERIRRGEIEKGDAFTIAKIAGIMAAKNAPSIIPLTHPILITNVEMDFAIREGGIEVRATVKARAQTGAEMEALASVMAALLSVFDVVKGYEKDELGQYPVAEIKDVKVISKTKRTI